jgi:hypothetical protein
MTTETPADKPRGNPPVHEISDGLLKAAIWQHDGEYGPRYSVTFRRRYKDGDEWKDTSSYGPDDLLPLGELTRDAYNWIKQQRRADREARREKESELATA